MACPPEGLDYRCAMVWKCERGGRLGVANNAAKIYGDVVCNGGGTAKLLLSSYWTPY